MSIPRAKPREPLQSYLDHSNVSSVTLKSPLVKKQLLILDLNGTLVSRLKPTTALYARPYHGKFFDYIFENFDVMVWSSGNCLPLPMMILALILLFHFIAQPQNVNNMCRIFDEHRSKLRLIWDRKKFGLSLKEYNSKTLTIKDLERVWQQLPEFGPTNTILLDDSPEKTVLQPYNHCVVSEFDHKSPDFKARGDCELMLVMAYLKKLQYQDNVCNYIKNHLYVSSPIGVNDEEVGPEEKEGSTAALPSTICYHYVFSKHDGDPPLPTSCDLGVVDELTSKIDRLKL